MWTVNEESTKEGNKKKKKHIKESGAIPKKSAHLQQKKKGFVRFILRCDSRDENKNTKRRTEVSEEASASAAACLWPGRRAGGFREQTGSLGRKINEGTTRQVGLADEGKSDQASKSPTLTRKNERRFERERQRGVKLREQETSAQKRQN